MCLTNDLNLIELPREILSIVVQSSRLTWVLCCYGEHWNVRLGWNRIRHIVVAREVALRDLLIV